MKHTMIMLKYLFNYKLKASKQLYTTSGFPLVAINKVKT